MSLPEIPLPPPDAARVGPIGPPGDGARSDRPRERLMRHGAQVLTDAELLAIMLRTGSNKVPVVQLGQTLIEHFGSLRSLLSAKASLLLQVHGLGIAKACQIAAISELARRGIAEELSQGCAMSSPERVERYCQSILAHRRVEHCIALYLNARLQLIACVELARGTVSEAVVYPREVVSGALEHNATAVILAHNHPSGTLAASQADISLTKKIASALTLVDIRLIDHLIIAGHRSVSMAQSGQL
ncbi:MAG: JAB domain-containing protein [Alcaligenaceae bacterium]|nr:MAG: JAB domain-containing protein [Alcaligenaceae bacterium]